MRAPTLALAAAFACAAPADPTPDPTASDADSDAEIDPTPQPGDIDGDGLANADDPTPEGSRDNVLNGDLTGGHARVVAIDADDGSGLPGALLVYSANLDGDCETGWRPQGVVCDHEPGTHDPDVSTRTQASFGAAATWFNGAQQTVGVVVIDACWDGGCEAIDFEEVRVFQQFSDGKVTAVRLSTHAELGDEAPAWDDPAWEIVDDWIPVGPGSRGDEAAGGDPWTVRDPAALLMPRAVKTRHLRVEAVNDGSLGDPEFVELHQVKLFGARPLR
jgi:hypothetical protein